MILTSVLNGPLAVFWGPANETKTAHVVTLLSVRTPQHLPADFQ